MRCRLGWHKWTRWRIRFIDKYEINSIQRRECAKCNITESKWVL